MLGLAVVGQQFVHLPVQVFDVLRVRRAVAIVGMVPVGLRVVDAPLHSAAMAGVRNLAHDVFAIRRARAGDLIIGELRIELAEAVVVLGGEHEILHAGVLGKLHPLVGVELDRVEDAVEVIVDLHRDVAGVGVVPPAPFPGPGPTDLGADDAHRTPVDEHSEAQVFPAFDRGGGRARVGLRPRGQRREGKRTEGSSVHCRSSIFPGPARVNLTGGRRSAVGFQQSAF